MQATREYPSRSLLTRFLQGWRDFETAMETQPVDHLELRVAALERRIVDLDAAQARPAPLRTVKGF